MKKFTILVLCLLFFGCNAQDSGNSESSVSSSTEIDIFQTLIQNLKTHQLSEYYNNKSEYNIEEEDATDYANISVRAKEGYVVANYYFSKVENDLIKGDLNGDKIDDIIVSVISNFGGNSDFTNYFLFESTDNYYVLSNPESWEIENHCQGEPYGMLIIKKIENNKIIGESNCLTEDDPRCCPSKIYETIFTIQKGKLVHETTNFLENRTIEYYQQN